MPASFAGWTTQRFGWGFSDEWLSSRCKILDRAEIFGTSVVDTRGSDEVERRAVGVDQLQALHARAKTIVFPTPMSGRGPGLGTTPGLCFLDKVHRVALVVCTEWTG